MPIESPAGFLYTLEEMVTFARSQSDVDGYFMHPVLLVVAPHEDWAEITAVRMSTNPEPEPVSVTMLPTLTFNIESKTKGAPKIRFGRAASCDVVMPFAAISKSHGFFQSDAEGNWSVGDFGSKNGTYVDGKKVHSSELQSLRNGATLRFGDVTAKFLLPSSFVADLKRRIAAT